MEKISFLRIIILSLVVSVLTGCSHSSVLDQYPRENLNRPYTLPKGLNSWKFIGSGAVVSDAKNSSTSYLSLFPLFWEQSISDDFLVQWSPIPMGLKYQFYNSSKYRLGASANVLGSPLFRSRDFTWSPFIQVDQRYRANSWVGLDFSYFGQLEIRKSVGGFNSTQGFFLGPVFQLTQNVSVSSQLRLIWEYGGVRALYFGPEPEGQDRWRLRLPVSGKVTWFFSRSWEVEAEGIYLKWHYPQSYTSQQYFLSVIHYL